jgi:hypothetical protein
MVAELALNQQQRQINIRFFPGLHTTFRPKKWHCSVRNIWQGCAHSISSFSAREGLVAERTLKMPLELVSASADRSYDNNEKKQWSKKASGVCMTRTF